MYVQNFCHIQTEIPDLSNIQIPGKVPTIILRYWTEWNNSMHQMVLLSNGTMQTVFRKGGHCITDTSIPSASIAWCSLL